jgi:hypothetical protein
MTLPQHLPHPTMATTTLEPTFSSADPISKPPPLTHTATNISMSPELFEKLYLSPKVPHAESVVKYANATPLGFLGYVEMKMEGRILC